MDIFYLLFGAVLPLFDLPNLHNPQFMGEAVDVAAIMNDGKNAKCTQAAPDWNR